MSGSCSPVTERQIAHAVRNGYEGIAIDGRTPEVCVDAAIAALRHARKVVVYSSLGPLPAAVPARGDTLGRQIGSMLRQIIIETGVRRVVLAGGDTSSHAVSQLGLYALTWSAATQPGAPLCRTHSDSPRVGRPGASASRADKSAPKTSSSKCEQANRLRVSDKKVLPGGLRSRELRQSRVRRMRRTGGPARDHTGT